MSRPWIAEQLSCCKPGTREANLPADKGQQTKEQVHRAIAPHEHLVASNFTDPLANQTLLD